MSCNGVIPACAWAVQGQEFVTDLCILPLGCYDMVVGMDWLEECGSMWVDWAAKQLQFQHEGALITLAGVQSKLEPVQHISGAQLRAMEDMDTISHVVLLHAIDLDAHITSVPEEIQQLLMSTS